MVFNSLSFLIFFPTVVFLYYLINDRFRSSLLLMASCYFYMAFVPKYILVLLFLITVDYFLGQLIQTSIGSKRKLFLWLSITANLGTLFIFKYLNFFNSNLSALTKLLHWNYSPHILYIALPLGLSFHVFQSLSYVIEVYRGKYPAERNFITYALYVMFFPQLVAGPIERPSHLLPQIKTEHRFDTVNVRRGLERMLWGFFKKLVIADQIAVSINYLYAHTPHGGLALWFLIFLFPYQLYCDFSGYSDIALGSAKVLGFDLTENFNRPYAANSIGDFWRRWHISLSSWLRDYLYYPMVLSWGKVSKIKLYASLFITFVLIGLWHGANWTFVVMGALHGFYLVTGSLTQSLRQNLVNKIGLSKLPELRHAIQILIVFFLVSISWVFFRSQNIGQAWHILSSVGNLGRDFSIGISTRKLIIILGAIVIMETTQYYQSKQNYFYIFENKKRLLRYSWYYALILAIMIFGYTGTQAFIYFRF